jgi:CBS domain-containing protein
MKIVRHLINEKGRAVWSISPEATVFEALKIMAEKDVGALLVLDDEKLVGIFSERDYARKVILAGKSSKDTLVREIMSTPVVSVAPQQTILECMAIMTQKHIRHLPVVDEGRLNGVISIGDVMKAVIAEQGQALDTLERDVLGGDLLE